MTWLYLVIAVIIVAGIAWYIWSKRQAPAPVPAASGQIETVLRHLVG
jgi:hypothetical protein